jgi:hypothetical protein
MWLGWLIMENKEEQETDTEYFDDLFQEIYEVEIDDYLWG